MPTTTVPRTLLLTATPPGESGVGQLFLKELCRSFPSDRLCIAAIGGKVDVRDHALFPANQWLQLRQRESLHSRYRIAWATMLSRHLSFRLQSLEDRDAERRIVEFARERRVETVWAVLNSPLLFRLASRIGARLDVPLLGTVWDPPEGIGLHFGLDRLSRRLTRRHFAKAMRRCNRVSVISERMQSEYQAIYGAESVVLRHGIAPPDQRHINATDSADDGELRIGFCGSLYAEREWQALLKGLDELGWRTNGRRIRLIVAGKNVPRVFASSPAQFEFLGWRPMHEVIERLANCDFNYLPYWFHPAYSESVRLCFPTKLTTYLTTGRPVLYHGPQDAAVVDFFARYPVAECCHSLQAGRVADSIRRLANLTDDAYASMIEAGRRAVQEELNLDVFLLRFRQLFGVDTGLKTQVGDARMAEAISSHQAAVALR